MYLLNTVMDNTKSTIIQHYYWPNLRNEIRNHMKVFKTCQKNKKKNNKYDHLPAKEAEAISMGILSVDIIGRYEIRR